MSTLEIRGLDALVSAYETHKHWFWLVGGSIGTFTGLYLASVLPKRRELSMYRAEGRRLELLRDLANARLDAVGDLAQRKGATFPEVGEAEAVAGRPIFDAYYAKHGTPTGLTPDAIRLREIMAR